METKNPLKRNRGKMPCNIKTKERKKKKKLKL